MLLAAMLAMVLAAAAAPALAQTATGEDSTTLQYSCDQIQAAVDTQYQAGQGTAAAASAAADLGIDQQQVLACFGTAAALQDSQINVNVGGGGGGGGGAAATAAGGALPPTGGASLIALGAGALLVAGGLLARRIVR
jgi:hypothetical protein